MTLHPEIYGIVIYDSHVYTSVKMWKIVKKMARYNDEHLGITKFSSSVECDKICLISDVNWQWGQRVCSIKWEEQTKLYLILNTVGKPQGIYGLSQSMKHLSHCLVLTKWTPSYLNI